MLEALFGLALILFAISCMAGSWHLDLDLDLDDDDIEIDDIDID